MRLPKLPNIPPLPQQWFNIGTVALAVASLAASWFLQPGEDARWVFLPDGRQFGETCAFLAQTGFPCPQCGMTRSFVHAARGNLVDAFWLSPGGLGLFLWVQAGGIVGVVRLVTRRPHALAPPWEVLVGWTAFWILGLYVLPFVLRVQGINPLP